uniref:Ion_trans domain-containing protein n=1 Tax=Macrostomum lignano TaxID=282301 RepID=A0A1I8INY7_9PLAT
MPQTPPTKNGTDERPQLAEFSSDHPALSSRASTGLFIAITAMAFLFLLEVCDLVLCAASFCINLSLLVARVTPLARDFVALLITFRLVRLLTLFGGLTRAEKRQILRMLDGYRREESFNLEQQRMLQTELENRTRECQDLRELVKSATLSRNRLRQKQMGQHQLKQEDGSPNEESCTDVTGGSPDNSRTGTRSVPDDSGHSSDSSPDSPPRETFGRGLESSSTEAPQIGIELAEVADSNPQPAQDELDEGGAFTSKF